jgi:MerR family transcriptional regulator, copper efflux regulator
VDRLASIRDAQASGLTLAEIGQVLAIRDAGQPPFEHVTALIGEHLTQVESRITELQSARAALVELSRRAATTDPAGCREGICPIITGR